MAALAGPRSFSGHHFPGRHHHCRAPFNSGGHFAAVLRAAAGFVVHPGDFLRNSAALDSEGALARSAANFLRSADDYRSGLHHWRSGQLFCVVVFAGYSDGQRAVLAPWRFRGDGFEHGLAGGHHRAQLLRGDSAHIGGSSGFEFAEFLAGHQLFCVSGGGVSGQFAGPDLAPQRTRTRRKERGVKGPAGIQSGHHRIDARRPADGGSGRNDSGHESRRRRNHQFRLGADAWRQSARPAPRLLAGGSGRAGQSAGDP